jgi:hypothetical protein
MDITEAAGLPQHSNSWYIGTSYDHPMDSCASDSLAPQVPFHTLGFTGSLIIESQQGQFCDGLGRVNSTPICIFNIENTGLST